jgi:hypothetical protein
LRGAGFVIDRAADGDTGYRLGRSEAFDAAIPPDKPILRTITSDLSLGNFPTIAGRSAASRANAIEQRFAASL